MSSHDSNWTRIFVVAISALGLSQVPVNSAQARDAKLMLPIKKVTEGDHKHRLERGIDLYFGKQSHPDIEESHGVFVTNKKTNAFNKSDTEACEWVMLSALRELQDRAQAEGGNAVVNIRSYYDKKEVSSTSKYECHAGNVVAGVALKGEVVTLEGGEDDKDEE